MPRPKAIRKRKPFPIQRKNESWRDFSDRENAWWAESRRISALEEKRLDSVGVQSGFLDEEFRKRIREDDERCRQQMKERDEDRGRLEKAERKQEAEEAQERKRQDDARIEARRANQKERDEEDRRDREAWRRKEEEENRRWIEAARDNRQREERFFKMFHDYVEGGPKRQDEWREYWANNKPEDEPFR